MHRKDNLRKLERCCETSGTAPFARKSLSNGNKNINHVLDADTYCARTFGIVLVVRRRNEVCRALGAGICLQCSLGQLSPFVILSLCNPDTTRCWAGRPEAYGQKRPNSLTQ